jgi:hypothetical protein
MDESRQPATAPGGSPRPGRASTVDATRLWSGGAATMLVAALVALVALLVSTIAFDVTPVAPGWLLGDGSDATLATRFALTAAGAALLATGLLHLMLLSTPRPIAFFDWIVALVTVAAAVTPFAVSGDLSEQAATCVIASAVGLVIVILLPSVVRSGRRTA